jgi:hypothetical protein
MFKDKGMKIVEKPYVVELRLSILYSIWWMSMWPSLGARLLSNMCSMIEIQLKRNM